MKKRTLLILIIVALATKTFAQSKMEVLHNSIMPYLKQQKKSTKKMTFYPWEDNAKDFITVFESNDTLFLTHIYEERNNIIITKTTNTSKTAEDKTLMMLCEILIPVLGYEKTLELYTPSFNKDCWTFLQKEIKKAEEKLSKILFYGKPEKTQKPYGYFIDKEGMYNYYGPNNWIVALEGIDYLAALSSNSEREPIGGISIYYDNSIINCNPFGCYKNIVPISLDEFKTYYEKTNPFK